MTGCYFDAALGEALGRNALRPVAEQVSKVGILATYKRLVVPSLTEGFDCLYHVRAGEAGTFIVEPVIEGEGGAFES